MNFKTSLLVIFILCCGAGLQNKEDQSSASSLRTDGIYALLDTFLTPRGLRLWYELHNINTPLIFGHGKVATYPVGLASTDSSYRRRHSILYREKALGRALGHTASLAIPSWLSSQQL